ncbi:polysaccharide deacetylase family protein [Marichromatium gracile]|nr:polysaccharide deacetylase family protein [Marichromatium gracile]MCF1184941.1 polysaccharide deacetylase family protein [Marichromatium gracile]
MDTASTCATDDTPRTLVSVHDVMPETLPRVERLLALLEAERVYPVTLLVVPGGAWDRTALARLRQWQQRGHELAGHGWHHRVGRYGGWYHRLHARLISRDVAEHLALDAEGIGALISRCHAWFGDQGLDAPELYVPPAWAMGRIARSALAELPFERYEYLSGVLSAESGLFAPVPMLGYEADTAARARAVRLWNRINRSRARARGWLRIGIHPQDLELRLAESLRQDLRGYRHHSRYAALTERRPDHDEGDGAGVTENVR